MEASLAALHQEFESAIQELCNQNQQLQAECQSLPAALNNSQSQSQSSQAEEASN
ncbi:hypothetical protein GX48_03397 [Paracoccidioides brasiliensis]|nr:hypothetical protein GX48_03397 [Paracoccidioides brasiliensis]